VGSAGGVAAEVTIGGDATLASNGTLTIANAAVTLAKMANLAANSFLGNNTGSPATPIALTVAQATAALNAMVGDTGSGGTKGLVPAPAAGDAAKFLNGAGGYSTPAGGSGPTIGQAIGLAGGTYASY
jgi:hypothetical protein